jgi:hypothetical protein
MVITETFTNEGSNVTWTVPPGVTNVTISVWGAAGGSGSTNVTGNAPTASESTGGYGRGGKAKATFPVSPGDELNLFIGSRGGTEDPGYPDGLRGFNREVSDGNNSITIEADAAGGGGSTRVEGPSGVLIQAGGGGGGGGGVCATSNATQDSSVDADAGGGGYANTQDGGDADAFAVFERQFSDDSELSKSASGGQNGGDSSARTEADSSNTRAIAGASGGGGGGRTPGGGGDANGETTQSGTSAVAVGGGGSGTSYIRSSGAGGNTSNNTTSPDNGLAGEVVIEYEEPPEAPDLVSATGGERQVDVSWTNDPDGYDSVEVYRETMSGGQDTADYTLVATLGGAAESYSDTSLLDGEAYFYRVRGVAAGNSTDLSMEASDITALPAPTDLSHPSTDDESAAYAWTATHNNGETRVEYRRAGGGDDWTTHETVARDVESATVDGLLNGEQYESRVVAQTEHAETEDT